MSLIVNYTHLNIIPRHMHEQGRGLHQLANRTEINSFVTFSSRAFLLQFIYILSLQLLIGMANLAQSIILTPRIAQKLKPQLNRSNANGKKFTVNLSPNQFSERHNFSKQYSQQAAKKSKLSNQESSPFFQRSPTTRLADSKAVRQVQAQLEGKYKYDLSGYLRKKFKQFVVRRQETDHRERHFTSALNHSSSQESKSIPSFRGFLTLDKDSPSKQRRNKVVNEAYLQNAKQKIERMIELKHQREEYYTDIRDNLKRKLLEKVNNRQRTSINEQKRQEIRTKISDQQWDQKWLSEYINEKSRYRKRLITKNYNRKFQENPLKI